MLRTGYYGKHTESIQFFNPALVIYMRAHVNSSAIAENDFSQNLSHDIIGCIINLSPMFFILSLVLNLSYIEYTLCQMWSVYMQYLRCYAPSN